jgi:hypothetical protein
VDFHNNDLYVSQLQWNSVLQFSTAGGPHVVADDSAGTYATPVGIAISNGGDVYATSVYGTALYKNGNYLLDLSSEIAYPGALRLVGEELFIMGSLDGTILKYNIETGDLSPFANIGNYLASFLTPDELFILDLAGGIYSVGDMVSFTPVPEPNSLILAMTATAFTFGVFRRRNCCKCRASSVAIPA